MVRWLFLSLLGHKSDCDVREEEQQRHRCLRQENSHVMNDVELLSGHGCNFGVDTVYKISEQFQRTPPDQEHNYAHDSTPDQDLRNDFKRFVDGVRIAHLIPFI